MPAFSLQRPHLPGCRLGTVGSAEANGSSSRAGGRSSASAGGWQPKLGTNRCPARAKCCHPAPRKAQRERRGEYCTIPWLRRDRAPVRRSRSLPLGVASTNCRKSHEWHSGLLPSAWKNEAACKRRGAPHCLLAHLRQLSANALYQSCKYCCDAMVRAGDYVENRMRQQSAGRGSTAGESRKFHGSAQRPSQMTNFPLLHSSEHEGPARARPHRSSALGSDIAWQIQQVRFAAVPRERWQGRQRTALPFRLWEQSPSAFVGGARACPRCVPGLPRLDGVELLVAGIRVASKLGGQAWVCLRRTRPRHARGRAARRCCADRRASCRGARP